MKIKPILALISLLALTLLFFWKILLTNLILVSTDTFLYFYPYKAYAAEALRQGRLPLWNPHLFMGAPLLANSQVGVFYPLNWPLLWLDAPKQVAWSIGLHIALAGNLMLLFARQSLGLSWPAALTAASLFAFGGYLGAQVEHINQLNAAAWLPALFLLYDWGIRPTEHHSHRMTNVNWLWFWLMALVVALTLLAGHAQTVFISLFGVGLYALWRAGETTEWQLPYRLSFWRSLGESLLCHLLPLAIVSLMAVALAAIQLLPTVELSGLSIRQAGLTFQEVVSFSTNPTTLHYSMLPPYGVDLSQIMGEAFGEWVAYVGISGLILAGLGGLMAIWQPVARRFLFLAISGLGLSLGLFLGPLYLFDIYIGLDSRLFHLIARATHPYYLLYYLVPGFDLFRVPARWLLLYSFGMAVLAGYGLDLLRPTSPWQNPWVFAGRWLIDRWWRLLILVGLPVIYVSGLMIWQRPPLLTLFSWLILAGLTVALLRPTPRLPFRQPILLLLVISELVVASQSLNYNQPTAPQAYHSWRNSVAYLRSVDSAIGPPDRFLSLSGTVYDPGDLADLERIYGDRLSPAAFYKLVVATKQKEVLFFNLPLIYGLHSVDGYDGGILPLAQFVTLQRLFLPADELSIDGRLREKLRFVPPGRLLSLLNTRWIITDKVFDAWIDGIFYDLQFPARLTHQQTITATDLPTFRGTAVGIVSHLVGASDLPAETPVADLRLTFADGTQQTLTLTAGRDTAEGNYSAEAAHPPATIGTAWAYGLPGVDYIAVYPLTRRQPVVDIAVTARVSAGQFVLRGLSLIHQPTMTSRSVILSTEGDYRRVHSGDVKIYENLAVLPRAYVVHQADWVDSWEAALPIIKEPTFDPRQRVVMVAPTSNDYRSLSDDLRLENRHSSLDNRQSIDQAKITSYQPERVEVAVSLDSPGWLVLSDTVYPGWQVTVNGQPADIIPANLLFRAVELPAGEHQVVFTFQPRSFQIGAGVSGVALLGLVVGLAIGFRRTIMSV